MIVNDFGVILTLKMISLKSVHHTYDIISRNIDESRIYKNIKIHVTKLKIREINENKK